jgi:hypothetical protein
MSPDVDTLSTFHGSDNALPPEITLIILRYVLDGTELLPIGGGVSARNAHHPIASVSRALRELYLGLPYPATTNKAHPLRYNIGEVLDLDDLQTMVAFYSVGPGRVASSLGEIRCLNISYQDNDAVDWWRNSTTYAYEAFELLHKHWNLMSVDRLRIFFRHAEAISSVDDPGIWSLLKIRALPHLDLVGPRRCVSPRVRAFLKARTRSKNLFPWRPLGVENPGPKEWTALVKYQYGVPRWQAQFEWLDARYKFLHDPETIAARCGKQRTAYHKRRKRWPMLSKGRRRSRPLLGLEE